MDQISDDAVLPLNVRAEVIRSGSCQGELDGLVALARRGVAAKHIADTDHFDQLGVAINVDVDMLGASTIVQLAENT